MESISNVQRKYKHIHGSTKGEVRTNGITSYNCSIRRKIVDAFYLYTSICTMSAIQISSTGNGAVITPTFAFLVYASKRPFFRSILNLLFNSNKFLFYVFYLNILGNTKNLLFNISPKCVGVYLASLGSILHIYQKELA